jgi:Protein of unknown function (DUF1189).
MNFFKQIFDAYIHIDFTSIYYQKVSRTISKILLLFLTMMIISTVQFYFGFTNGFNEIRNAMNNSPYFTIKNGELSIDTPQPYYPIEGGSIIIDTTGKTSPSVLDSVETGILVTKTKFYSKSGNYENRSFDLKTINELSGLTSVTRNDLTSWIMNLKAPIFIIVMIVIAIYQFFAKTISIFILTLAALIAASATKKHIKYGTMFNISAYSIILSVSLYWLRSLIGVSIPSFFVIYWAPAIVYTVMGVKKYMEPQIQPQFQQPMDPQPPIAM